MHKTTSSLKRPETVGTQALPCESGPRGDSKMGDRAGSLRSKTMAGSSTVVISIRGLVSGLGRWTRTARTSRRKRHCRAGAGSRTISAAISAPCSAGRAKARLVHRAAATAAAGVPVYAFASELETWRRSAKGRTTVAADDTDPPAGPAVPSGISSAPGTRLLRRAPLLASGCRHRCRHRNLRLHPQEEETPPGLDPGRASPPGARPLYRGTYLWNGARRGSPAR